MNRQTGNRRRYALFLGTAVVAVLATAAAVHAVTSDPGGAPRVGEKPKYRETISRAFELAPGATLRIANDNGPIEVIGYDGRRVELVVQKRLERPRGGHVTRRLGFSSAPSPELDAMFDSAGFSVTISEVGADVSARAPRPAGEARVVFDLRLRVPRDADVVAHTANGTVVINDIRGHVSASSQNGEVECAGVDGGVDASSDNGGIYCKRIGGGIVARTKNGPIRIDARDALEGFPIHAETDNGEIRLRVAGGASFGLTAGTANGRVRATVLIDGEVLQGARRKVQGHVGSGGPIVDLRSWNGSIYLNDSQS